ncbi:portal protein [Enterovibrio sp. 27052020O]|uniref:portal protein n=1 Tax=Enterovibrio sp. 27052020O TaxID=3241166 RepID=UPI0038911273
MTAALKDTGIDTQALTVIMSDIDGQPGWRSNANRACAYYDGDQLDPKVVAVLRERGQPETMHNLIAPAIDGVLGMEAKTRTDLMVIADDPDEEMEKLAEAVNAEFSDACRLSRLDRARSEAYAGQVKCGVGFVEVYRNPDPFGPKYKAKNIPRDEVFWDWLSVEPDWSDCQWVMRQRWEEVDTLKAMLPHKAEVLDYAVKDWDGFADVSHIEGIDANLVSAWEEYQGWSRSESEYLSQNRKRIRLQIVYRRVIERKPVIHLSDGRVIEFDKNNLAHATAVAMGRAEVTIGQTSTIIETWFAGPHKLGARKCQAPYGMFPIVPFFGYRKDKSGEPYGLISRAIPAQDEVNFRRLKLTWLLQAKRVIADDDATNLSRDQVMEQVERPDGYIPLNPDRRNKKTISEAFQVQSDFNIAAQQFQVMQDSMKLIQDTMGIYSAFLGQEGGADSGVAIANLVEQGATTLAEVNDNYRLSCQLLGELMLGYILEDMAKQKNKRIVINRDDKQKRKPVILNEETEQGLNNDITRLRAHIALAPIQQTTAYKAQLADRMMLITANMPPQVQMAVFDLVCELSDVPNKQEFMERVRGALNLPKDPEDMTPEEQQAFAQQQQKAAAQEELAMREMNAKVGELEAKVTKLQSAAMRDEAEAQSKRYDNAKKQAETGKILAEMQQVTEELNRVRADYDALLTSQIDALQL